METLYLKRRLEPMFFGLLHIEFESSDSQKTDLKFMSSLCRKLEARFKVIAKTHRNDSNQGSNSLKISIVYLNSDPKRLDSVFDKITNFSEQEGYGRVEIEKRIIESVDTILWEE